MTLASTWSEGPSAANGYPMRPHGGPPVCARRIGADADRPDGRPRYLSMAMGDALGMPSMGAISRKPKRA